MEMFYNIMKVLFFLISAGLIIVGIIIFKRDRQERLKIIFSILMSAFFLVLGYLVNKIQIELGENKDAKTTRLTETTSSKTTAISDTVLPTENKAQQYKTNEETNNNITNVYSKNAITKKLNNEDECYTASFIAPISGKYRFDFISNDVQTDFIILLVDSKNEILFNSEYSTYEHGETQRLSKGEIYTLTIKQSDGYPQATVKINVPSEVAKIEFVY